MTQELNKKQSPAAQHLQASRQCSQRTVTLVLQLLG